MSYWVLVLLAMAAGALFGALRSTWPWQRPHPVRGTISFALPLIGFVVLLAGHFMRWDEGWFGRWAMLTGIGVPLVVSVWLAPSERIWNRLAMTAFVGYLAYMWYAHAPSFSP